MKYNIRIYILYAIVLLFIIWVCDNSINENFKKDNLDKEYITELICDVSKERDRFEKLKPLIEVFNITPSYYVDKVDVKENPLYNKFKIDVSDSERSLTINQITILQKNKDSGKFVLMFQSDVKLLVDISIILSEIDKTVKEMKENNVGIAFLGKGDIDKVDISKYEKISETLYITGLSRCAEAYIMSPNCIEKYLNYFKNTNNNVVDDWNFNYFLKATPDIIGCYRIPELFEQDKIFLTLLDDRIRTD